MPNIHCTELCLLLACVHAVTSATATSFNGACEESGTCDTDASGLLQSRSRFTGEVQRNSARSVTKDQFSYVGQAAITAMEKATPQGASWHMVDDLDLHTIIPTPHIFSSTLNETSWTRLLEPSTYGLSCNSSSDRACNQDFERLRCNDEAGCNGFGTCTPLKATVTTPGQEPEKLCLGPADVLVDHYYDAISNADEMVDITSLDSPDFVGQKVEGSGHGRFVAAIRNAITFLSHSGKDVVVKMVFGSITNTFSGTNEDPAKIISALTRDLHETSQVKLYVGAYRSGLLSWDHGKIVAVDGRTLLWGGINFYTEDYLQKDPVFDISMQAGGAQVATAGHMYADYLWTQAVNKITNFGPSMSAYSKWIQGKTTSYNPYARTWPLPPLYTPKPPATTTPGLRAVVANRFGAIGPNPSDDAFVAVFESAKKEVRISAQDIGPLIVDGSAKISSWILGWPDNYLYALNSAMSRGVDVRMVLSNPCAWGGGVGNSKSCYVHNDFVQLSTGQNATLNATLKGGPYGYGWSRVAVLKRFQEMDNWQPAFANKLKIAYIGVDGKTHWPDGEAIGNHAKFWAIDDQAYYVGSQNLYRADLAEFGIIVDDQAATTAIITSYFDAVWANANL